MRRGLRCWGLGQGLSRAAHWADIVRNITWVDEGIVQRHVLHATRGAQRHQHVLYVVVGHAAAAALVHEVLSGGRLRHTGPRIQGGLASKVGK